jgi:hypothetical protein
VDRHVVAVEEPGRDQPVAAVVAAAGDHRDGRPRGGDPTYRPGDGVAAGLHQLLPRDPERRGVAVHRGHPLARYHDRRMGLPGLKAVDHPVVDTSVT